MKKMTKRIMALMLSLVMVLGCIPSFINEASAAISNVGDVLATVEFPTTDNYTTIPDNAWVSSEGKKIYKCDNFLFCYTGSNTRQLPNLNENVSATEGGYIFTDSNHTTFNFVMTGDKLTSIIISNDTHPCDYVGTYEPVVKTITEVNLVSSGILATNIQTLKYEVPDGADYTIDDDLSSEWYDSTDYDTQYNFSTTGTAYKKIVLKPKSGFKFDANTKVYLNGDLIVDGNGIINDDGTLSKDWGETVKAGTISLNFPKPKTYSEFKNLNTDFNGDIVNSGNGPKLNFSSLGQELFAFKDSANSRFTDITENSNDTGYYLLQSIYKFNSKEACLAIEHVYYRDKELEIVGHNKDIFSGSLKELDKIKNMKTNAILCIRVIDETSGSYYIHIFEKVDLRKNATITFPADVGTKVENLKNNVTLSDSTNKASLTSINIYEVVDGKISASTLLTNDKVLEKDKEYYVLTSISDEENEAYTLVTVNNVPIYSMTGSGVMNGFSKSSGLKVYYIINLKEPASSSGSKKYKASDSNDTAEKVSGSGKKGSTRTITPIEGKKVSSVIVKDKDGNKVDVTLNEDGTYSFKQPASDVTIEVIYKNREITLNIGSTEASVDGEKSNLDVCPVTRNDRTMLPIRFIAENLGAKVEWNELETNMVYITRGDTKIEIKIGSDIMKVNGKEVKLDSVAFAENDRTYLPVRAISEALNAIVEWNEERPMEVKIYER